MKTLRIEVNGGAALCLAIISATVGIIAVTGAKEKTKKDIEFKKIENELRYRHANMVAGCGNE